MFRIPLVILLVAAILTQSLSKGLIVLSYFTNKQAYERYCVNKARPQLHCNGKCQMALKLKAEAERDQKDPLKGSAFSEVVMTDQNHFVQIAPVVNYIAARAYLFPYTMGQTKEMPHSFFHPPGTVA